MTNCMKEIVATFQIFDTRLLTEKTAQGRMPQPICIKGDPRKMSAIIVLRKKEFIVRHGMTIRSAVLKLELQPESVLPTRKGELISEEDIIQDGDVITLIPVISGG